MAFSTDHMRVRSAGGELVRSDVITVLRQRGGEVDAIGPGGAVVRLAGPGCPPGFHLALLRELELQGQLNDERWLVIISPEMKAGGGRWVSERLEEITEVRGQGR